MNERFAPGREFAGHRIVSPLGQGGMGVVFEAEHILLERRVALKVLAPSLANDEQFQQRFIRESRAAASLDHPHVIPIYEAGEAESILYLSMRFVDGDDLDSVIDRGLPPEKVLTLLAQAADALDAAHDNALVHRDVKPQNLLVERFLTESPHLYVTDFGLTKRLKSTSQLTSTGTFMGTLDYVSPEQIRGEDIGSWSDQYSLACVLFKALTGRVPFEGGSDLGVVHAHLALAPASASAVKPGLPKAIDEVFVRGLAKEPSERFASCSELLAAAVISFDLSPREVRSGTIRPLPETVPPLPSRSHPKTAVPFDRPMPATPSIDRQRHKPHRTRNVLLATLFLLVSGAAIATALVLTGGREELGRPLERAAVPSSKTASSSSPASTTSAPSIEAEKPSDGSILFESAIRSTTPWFNDVKGYYRGLSIDDVDAEVTLLSTWWALADYCTQSARAEKGECYDHAAVFMNEYFERDPRTINSQTWAAPGAIGALFDQAYATTASYLEMNAPQFVDISGRPGMDFVCEPTCKDVIDV